MGDAAATSGRRDVDGQKTRGREERMDVNAVAEYLKQNPQFFEDYADMIAEIFVPHPHGGHAIPIAERQIVTLREKNHELESKLRELIRFGSENEMTGEKVHRSTLALFAAPDLETTLAVIYHSLKEDFGVPEVAAAVLNKKVRTGAPLRLAGLADSTGGPAFSAAAGLLSFALHHHAAAQSQPASAEAQASRIGRIGSWIRENF